MVEPNTSTAEMEDFLQALAGSGSTGDDPLSEVAPGGAAAPGGGAAGGSSSSIDPAAAPGAEGGGAKAGPSRDFFSHYESLLEVAPEKISLELRTALTEFDKLPEHQQKAQLRELIINRRKGDVLRMALQPIIMHATKTNAGVVGINNEATSFTDSKGQLRYIGRIKSYAKDRGNNSYGFVECPEIHKKYGGDAFLRKDQYLECFEVGDKVSFLLDLSKEGKPQAIDLMPPDGQETEDYKVALRRMASMEQRRDRETNFGPRSKTEGNGGSGRDMLPVPDPLYEQKRRRIENSGGSFFRDHHHGGGLYNGSGGGGSSASSSSRWRGSEHQTSGADQWRDHHVVDNYWRGSGGNIKGGSSSSSSSRLPPPGMPNPFGPPPPIGFPANEHHQMVHAAALLASNPTMLQTAALIQAASALNGNSGTPSAGSHGGGGPTPGGGGGTPAIGWPARPRDRSRTDEEGDFGEALRQLLAAGTTPTSQTGPSGFFTSDSETTAATTTGRGGGLLGGATSSTSVFGSLLGGGNGNKAGGANSSNSLASIFDSMVAGPNSSFNSNEEFSQEDWTQFLQYLSTDPATNGT
ncbi:unnamed protein product [Amoebophrya sp. A120]|nr:unnamed protein product [Amoebophrya sp. A120]|eukprot:GSA120T00001916001.1